MKGELRSQSGVPGGSADGAGRADPHLTACNGETHRFQSPENSVRFRSHIPTAWKHSPATNLSCGADS